MKKNLFHIDVLGTKITFKSSENDHYMEQVIHILKEKIRKTEKIINTTDPLKISILTSMFLIDETMKENDSFFIENKLETLVKDLSEALE